MDQLMNSPAAARVRKMDSATIEYVVDNYSVRKRIGVGEAIESHQFVIGGHRWALVLYPRGLNDAAYNEGYASLYISLKSESVDEAVQFLFELFIRDRSDAGNDCRTVSTFNARASFKQVTCRSVIGHHHFIKRSLLDPRKGWESVYVRNDRLKIGVRIGVFTYHHHHRIPFISHQYVFFKVADQTFCAEKSIVATRCPTLLKDIVIPDVEPEIFKAVLWFIYKGRLHKIVRDAMGDTSVTCILESFAAKLLTAAHKFELQSLKTICEVSISKKVCRESVVDLLQLAHVCRAARLKSTCLRYVAKNKSVIMESDEYEHLKETRPSLFLDLAGSGDNSRKELRSYWMKSFYLISLYFYEYQRNPSIRFDSSDDDQFGVFLKWYGERWAKHERAVWFWFVIGSLCGVWSQKWLVKDHKGASAILGVLIPFGLCKLLRDIEFLRGHLCEHPWYFSAIGNGCAVAIALCVQVLFHQNTTHDAIYGFILLAITIMILMEIVQPHTDYGLLQFFLRMPLQISILHYGFLRLTPHILPAFFFIFATVYQLQNPSS